MTPKVAKVVDMSCCFRSRSRDKGISYVTNLTFFGVSRSSNCGPSHSHIVAPTMPSIVLDSKGDIHAPPSILNTAPQSPIATTNFDFYHLGRDPALNKGRNHAHEETLHSRSLRMELTFISICIYLFIYLSKLVKC